MLAALVAVAVASAGGVLIVGRLFQTGTVEGRVIQDVCNGTVPCWPRTMTGERVTFTSTTSRQVFSTSTDANGNFSVILPVGNYSIDIPSAAYSWSMQYNRLSRIDVGSDIVNVRANDHIAITLQIAPNQT